MSTDNWVPGVPIYTQIRQQVENRLLDGSLSDGDALPSVREMAAQMQVNPLTVLRAYQELQDAGLVEKQRGIGLRVAKGASEQLCRSERKRFLEEQWPRIQERLRLLGLGPSELGLG